MSNPDNSKEYILVNAYDELVKTHVKHFLNESDSCKCEKCFLDICAIVYNKGYSHFVTTTTGQLLAQVFEQKVSHQADLTVKVIEAIKRVSESPMH